MTLKFRRIKSYKPRIRRTKKEINKQRLHDMQHEISAHVGRLLVLIKEGEKEQVVQAQYKAKVDFVKTAPLMQNLAEHMGAKISSVVRRYLSSVEAVLHSNIVYLDPATIDQCYTIGQQLEKDIQVA